MHIELDNNLQNSGWIFDLEIVRDTNVKRRIMGCLEIRLPILPTARNTWLKITFGIISSITLNKLDPLNTAES